MAPSKATTVEELLAELPDDRREAVSTVRDAVVSNHEEVQAAKKAAK